MRSIIYMSVETKEQYYLHSYKMQVWSRWHRMRGFNIHMSVKSNIFCTDSDRVKNKFIFLGGGVCIDIS